MIQRSHFKELLKPESVVLFQIILPEIPSPKTLPKQTNKKHQNNNKPFSNAECELPWPQLLLYHHQSYYRMKNDEQLNFRLPPWWTGGMTSCGNFSSMLFRAEYMFKGIRNKPIFSDTS